VEIKPNNIPKETSRIEAFSDGVFAIAITLLVLELIQILHPALESGLIETCLHHWQSFLAFSVGFITILICWINHHVALECIYKTDTNFFWINGFLLFIVTLTPFPTAVMAEYLDTEGGTALAFFGFNYFLISIAANGICTYAYNHNLVREEHREFYNQFRKIYRYAIFYTLVVFLLCFISVVIPIILYILLFAAFSGPKQFAARLINLRKARVKT
jgi:uncharacterized membrane protein